MADLNIENTLFCCSVFVPEGRSQFAGLELSESQGPVGGGRDSQQQDKEVVSPQTEQERHSKPGGSAFLCIYAGFQNERDAASMNVNRQI